ncbi:MAG: Rpn family recombination-promoting nuclease/putative transposase [Candidatus Competibacteraceae bacterium]
MKTDSLFYRLFQDWPELVLELAELDSSWRGYALRAEEIKQTAFRLDGVLTPPDDRPDWPLVFIETQFQPDPDFHARWFSELFLYLYRRPPRRAWRAVTLFPNRTAEGTVEVAYEMQLAHPWVKRVYLEEALGKPTPSRGIRVLGLMLASPAMVVAEAQALLEEPAVDGPPSGPALVDWVETLLVYKLPRLSREEIRKMLNLLNVELKETRFFQEVFAEGLEEGRQEGRQEGQRAERLRIAQNLLDVIADDRLLAEKTDLSEAEVRELREKRRSSTLRADEGDTH